MSPFLMEIMSSESLSFYGENVLIVPNRLDCIRTIVDIPNNGTKILKAFQPNVSGGFCKNPTTKPTDRQECQS